MNTVVYLVYIYM